MEGNGVESGSQGGKGMKGMGKGVLRQTGRERRREGRRPY